MPNRHKPPSEPPMCKWGLRATHAKKFSWNGVGCSYLVAVTGSRWCLREGCHIHSETTKPRTCTSHNCHIDPVTIRVTQKLYTSTGFSLQKYTTQSKILLMLIITKCSYIHIPVISSQKCRVKGILRIMQLDVNAPKLQYFTQESENLHSMCDWGLLPPWEMVLKCILAKNCSLGWCDCDVKGARTPNNVDGNMLYSLHFLVLLFIKMYRSEASVWKEN